MGEIIRSEGQGCTVLYKIRKVIGGKGKVVWYKMGEAIGEKAA
jgi:hypothetical protein